MLCLASLASVRVQSSSQPTNGFSDRVDMKKIVLPKPNLETDSATLRGVGSKSGLVSNDFQNAFLGIIYRSPAKPIVAYSLQPSIFYINARGC
jgi:hypothetical protein